MSKTDSLHYQLCVEGAKWLRRRKNVEHCEGVWKYVTVEMCVQGCENPDIWGFNGWSTIVVEVKTSRSDFLNDRKKFWQQPGNEECLGGIYRYYLTPKGLLSKDDLPPQTGLLEWDGKNITRAIAAERHTVSNHADMLMMASLLRREGFKEGVYNYRGTPTTIKPKTVNGVPINEIKKGEEQHETI